MGEYVNRGQELAKIYAVDYAEIRLPVSDEELAHLELSLRHREPSEAASGEAQPALTLRTRFAGEEHSWQGRIVRTEGVIDPESRMVVLVGRVPDPYARGDETERAPLVAGLFVEAVIEGKTLREAIALPREAVQTGGRVHVLDDEDRLGVLPVDVLHTDGERVVVQGLDPGERVIVTPLELPVEGMRLRRAAAPQTAPGSPEGAVQGGSVSGR